MNAPARVAAATSVRALTLDDPRLAAFVAAHPDATPFHRPGWLAAVERGCGQNAHYLAADAGGVIIGVLPLTEMRSPLFGSALVSSGFAVDGGILASDAAAAAALADGAWELARKLGIGSVELRGGAAPDGWQVNEGVYAGFARDLPADEVSILAAIPRKQRAEVRRALTFDLEVRIGRDEADRADHYRIYAESVRNLGTPVFPRALFDAVLDAFGTDADILTVSRDGVPLASVLSLYHNGTVYPYWGGGIFEARKWRANDLMYFALMRYAAERGMRRFDFGRSKTGTGAYAFKKNWGFDPTPLSYASRTADDAAAREINPLNPRYRLQTAIWKKLPLWAANRLGPPIARGLG